MTIEQANITPLQSETTQLLQRLTALEHENATLRRQVDELQQQNQELRQSQELLRAVLEMIPGAVYIKDVQGKFLHVNHQCAASLNLTPEQMVGAYQMALFTPEEHATWQQREEEMLAVGQLVEREEVFPRADGPRTILVRRFPLYDAQGELQATGGIVTDITERRRMEEDLRLFYLLAENVPDAIGIATIHDARIFYANPAHRTLFGFGDESVGLPFLEIYAEDPEYMQAVVQECLAKGFWRGELRQRRRDGSVFVGHTTGFMIYDAEGQPVSIVGIMRDLTEQQRAEAERTALQEQMIAAQQSAIRELSTPLLPLANQVIVLPLVGSIDSARAQAIMETLLEGVARHQAAIAIIDITGVRIVDSQVAQALVSTAQAVKLLGAQVVITGVQPAIAQTLVHLGADLRGIVTRSTLQSGIDYALHQ